MDETKQEAGACCRRTADEIAGVIENARRRTPWFAGLLGFNDFLVRVAGAVRTVYGTPRSDK